MKKTATKKQTTSKRTSVIEEAPPKPIQIYELKLTLGELVHLRDVFSVVLPNEMNVTISQALAMSEYRQLTETKLWNKIVALCETAEIPMQEHAPDFVVAISGPPPMSIYRLEPNGNQVNGESEEESDEELDEEDSSRKD